MSGSSAASGHKGEPLQCLLDPMSLDEFLQNHLEQQPLHLSQREPEHFRHLASRRQLETLLARGTLEYPSTQLTRAGQPLPVADYTDDDGRIVPTRLAQHYAEGATVILSRAHTRLDSLATLCRAVQTQLKVRCQANLYLTPPGNRGFNPHYDSHDVFILQVEGRKSFRFYAGGPELPMSHQRFDAARSQPGAAGEAVQLQPGDTLYIPRGVMHDAVADDQGASLHITLGIYAITVAELLQALLSDATTRHPALRRSLGGLRWEGRSATSGMLAPDLHRWSAELLESHAVQAAIARLEDDLAIDVLPDCAGLLREPQWQAGLTLDTRVRLRADRLLNQECGAQLLKLRLPGQVLEFRAPLRTAVQCLLDQPEQRLGDLPGLDDVQRLDLGRRLLQLQLIEALVDLP